MKLYEVPRNSRIVTEGGKELNFSHVDGMYSYCTDDDGNVVHLAAWAEVEVKEKNS
jgi:hypothetical protein